ncbi:redoxin family protein [uncultured Tenacibaculum sp.]|uniref:redoxin family protein n=1 Tax=uncultured Tenacibaculum sp. TaxID=174713 RepID=UPI002638E41B|nr:redoxin family protein [uncultured Tenacibaculum sp.]
MKNILYNLKTALIAEHIKKRNTGIYTLSFIIGILSPLILFISRLNGSTRYVPRKAHNLHINFIENGLELYTYYMLPFLIILITSRITQLDHKVNGWQLMESLPVKKYANYFSKFSIVLFSNFIAIVSFVFMSLIFIYILVAINIIPEMGVLEFPSEFIIQLISRLFIGSLFLSALQYTISVLISNFLWPIFIGIIGFSLNTFFNESGLFFSWYPYGPISIIFKYPKGSDIGNILTYTDYISLVGSIIFLYVGYQWFKNKSLLNLFSVGNKMILQTISILVVFGSIFFWLQKPKQFLKHNNTVVRGKIVGDIDVKNVYIVDPFIKDTLTIIPINRDKFRIVLKDSLPLSTYELNFDDKYKTKAFFGAQDSVQVVINVKKGYWKSKIEGNRLVENKVISARSSRGEFNFMISLFMNDSIYHKTPQLFIAKLEEYWKKEIQNIKKYKTIDNYNIREDFFKLQQQLKTIKYKKYLDDFKKIAKVNNPKIKIILPKSLQHLEEPLLYNVSLLNNSVYLKYVLNQLVNTNKSNLDQNTKALLAISSLEKSSFKDKLMYWQLEKSIQESSIKDEIDSLLIKYSTSFTNDNLKRKINKKAIIIKQLIKGQTAPKFIANTLEGEKVKLEDLKGKYTVIDVWATWCTPCKKDTPYFEKYALKYTSDSIQFVSLSVDYKRDINTWKANAREMSKTIMQLHCLNSKNFMQAYNIRSIPRYMVIDSEGKIVNVNLPRPSKPSFEIVLKEVLNIK